MREKIEVKHSELFVAGLILIFIMIYFIMNNLIIIRETLKSIDNKISVSDNVAGRREDEI